MSKRTSKILPLFLSFVLFFQQTGFAQIAAELNIAGHLTALHNSFVVDKFRLLHLRYLQYLPENNSFKLYLDKGDQFKKGLSPQGTVPLEEQSKELLKYFFIGLSLPNDSFWVNLRPDAEDNIIDDYLSKTDIGKIMLETDLQLKKDTSAMTSPATPEGREYWDKLYTKAGEIFGSENITIPALTRPWIVPDEIILRETTGAESGDRDGFNRPYVQSPSAYIYKATLKVMLEEDYLQGNTGRGHLSVPYPVDNSGDPRFKALNEYSTQLIRELIIPKLTKEVNTSKRYAPLRQVYYSLILSQWFKARFTNSTNSTNATNPANLINSRNLTNLISKEPWSKTTYFQAYQKSFKDGEYNIQEPVYTPTGQVIRSYFSGGMQLTVTVEPFGAPVGKVSSAITAVSAFGQPQPGRNNISLIVTPDEFNNYEVKSNQIITSSSSSIEDREDTASDRHHIGKIVRKMEIIDYFRSHEIYTPEQGLEADEVVKIFQGRMTKETAKKKNLDFMVQVGIMHVREGRYYLCDWLKNIDIKQFRKEFRELTLYRVLNVRELRWKVEKFYKSLRSQDISKEEIDKFFGFKLNNAEDIAFARQHIRRTQGKLILFRRDNKHNFATLGIKSNHWYNSGAREKSVEFLRDHIYKYGLPYAIRRGSMAGLFRRGPGGGGPFISTTTFYREIETLSTIPFYEDLFNDFLYIIEVPDGEPVLDFSDEAERVILFPHSIPVDWVKYIVVGDQRVAANIEESFLLEGVGLKLSLSPEEQNEIQRRERMLEGKIILVSSHDRDTVLKKVRDLILKLGGDVSIVGPDTGGSSPAGISSPLEKKPEDILRISDNPDIKGVWDKIVAEHLQWYKFTQLLKKLTDSYGYFSNFPQEEYDKLISLVDFKSLDENAIAYYLGFVTLNGGGSVRDRYLLSFNLIFLIAIARAEVSFKLFHKVISKDEFSKYEFMIEQSYEGYNDLLLESIRDLSRNVFESNEDKKQGFFEDIKMIHGMAVSERYAFSDYIVSRYSNKFSTQIKILDEYAKQFLPEFFTHPHSYIESQEALGAQFGFGEGKAGLVEITRFAGPICPLEHIGKVRKFRLLNGQGVYVKRINPLRVRYPEEEIELSEKLDRVLQKANPHFHAQKFIGIVYDEGVFYLLSLAIPYQRTAFKEVYGVDYSEFWRINDWTEQIPAKVIEIQNIVKGEGVIDIEGWAGLKDILINGEDYYVIDFETQPYNDLTSSPLGANPTAASPAQGKSASSAMKAKTPGGIDFRALPIVTQAVSNLRSSLGDSFRLSAEGDTFRQGSNESLKRKMSPSALKSSLGDSFLRISSSGVERKLSPAAKGEINLSQELQEIQKLVDAGITPSTRRIEEYVASSCLRGNLDLQKVVSCIAGILRLEESRPYPTEPALKDLLVVLEAGIPNQELRTIFTGVR